MPFLTKRKSQSGRYYIRWTEKGKVKSVSTREKSYEKALKVFDAWRAGNGEIVCRNFTLKDLFNKRLDYMRLHFKKSTCIIYECCYRNYMKVFTNRPLSKVIPEDLETYKKVRNVSKTTINIDVRILKTTFRYGSSDNVRMLSKDPFANIKQFPIPEKKRVYIPDHELHLILDHCNNSLISEVIIHAINTGMRREEILNIRFKDVNIITRVIDIPETKTNTVRTIPVSDQLYLQLYKYFYDDSGCVRLYNPDDKIYKISGDYVTHTFKKIIRSLNLPDHYKFHSLRHTAITNLLRNSGNVYISMEIAGHKSIKTTQIYLHNIPDEVRSAVNSLSLKY